MESSPRFVLGNGFRPTGRRSGLARALTWFGGFMATGAALAVGAVLAVFAAAAVAVIALFASVLVFLAGLALRARRTVYARASASASPVMEARKVGHAWVAYGWDRTTR